MWVPRHNRLGTTVLSHRVCRHHVPQFFSSQPMRTLEDPTLKQRRKTIPLCCTAIHDDNTNNLSPSHYYSYHYKSEYEWQFYYTRCTLTICVCLCTVQVYRRLKAEVPWYRTKVTALEGDVSLPGLGLTAEDRQTLVDNVTVVLHGAATVRFNEPLRSATTINVLGTREILTLAKEMSNLKSIVHVSTAFANCNHLHIEEKFYNLPTSYEEIIQLLKSKDDAELEALTPR